MSIEIRVLLIVVSILTLWYVQRKIRKAQIKIEDAFYWLIVSACLVVISIFPQIPFYLSEILGFMAPINLVFLVIIFLLLIKIFLLSIKVSQLDAKLTALAEEVALNEKEHYEK